MLDPTDAGRRSPPSPMHVSAEEDLATDVQLDFCVFPL